MNGIVPARVIANVVGLSARCVRKARQGHRPSEERLTKAARYRIASIQSAADRYQPPAPQKKTKPGAPAGYWLQARGAARSAKDRLLANNPPLGMWDMYGR